MTMENLYQETMDKQIYLEKMACKYISIWERTFDKEIKQNKTIKEYVDSIKISTHLEPRDSFYGR